MNRGFRPPAVPLVTVDPYFSVWSMADRLYDDYPRHWTGQPNGMTGLAQIDGVPWRFLGKLEADEGGDSAATPVLEQTGLKVEPLTSTYVFQGGGISLTVEFMTPLLLDRLEILSRPVSYVTFTARSLDAKRHRVKLYFDVTGEWCVNTKDQEIVWSRKALGPDLEALAMGSRQQAILGQSGDDLRIDWGYFYLLVPKSANLATRIGSHRIRKEFWDRGELSGPDDPGQPRAVSDDTPVMACAVDLEEVGQNPVRYFLGLAYDDRYAVEYFQKPLPAYWRSTGVSAEEMLRAAVADYPALVEACREFNRQLRDAAVSAGGEKYADILALAYRQAIAAHKLVADEDGTVLFFSKECFSNGCIGTVDVSYPSLPLFLLYNPELAKGMMRPIFKYAGSKEWPHPFAPHDVGCYPKANGQVYRMHKEALLDKQMPVEECGNMLIMTAAVCLAEGKADFAAAEWEHLTKWAEYLMENGLDPGDQLCTDDFAGHLAHNANLSLKAIMGIAGYAILCGMLGKVEARDRSLAVARRMAREWEVMAVEGDHYKLTFDMPGTWSLKYNLIWDDLFGTHLFPQAIKEREVAWYIAKRNKYGTPLDHRKDYTKVDWLLWVAALAGSNEDFERLIDPVWDFLNETPSRIPFTDWYDTVTGTQTRSKGFRNRSVVGGVFIKLLKPANACQYL